MVADITVVGILKKSKLISLFKILNGYLFPPPPPHSFRPPHFSSMLTRSYHPNNLFVPRACTSAFLSSFVPNSCSLWNSLPSSLKVCQSLGSFKYSLRNFSPISNSFSCSYSPTSSYFFTQPSSYISISLDDSHYF